MTVRDFFGENLNSCVELEIDSKPANAHGDRATILNVAERGLFSGAKRGVR